MLHESDHVRAEADDGVATVWLEFPGDPVNALSPGRLAEVARAVAAAQRDPHVEVLVVRSGRPAGFCGGHDPAALDTLRTSEEAALYALAGQRQLGQIANAVPVTLAFVEGPCLGPGLELALACDWRVAVAGPDSWVGDPGDPLTAREAVRAGLFDDAFCARRGKIELRAWLDRLQAKPRKRRRRVTGTQLAAERRAFGARSVSEGIGKTLAYASGSDGPVELALRGHPATADDANAVGRALAEAVRRGRATPLEAEQARARITIAPYTERTVTPAVRAAA